MDICKYIDSNWFVELENKKTRFCERVCRNQCVSAVRTGISLVSNTQVMLIIFDKSQRMGTIGVLEGEKITVAFEYATRKKIPVVAVVSSAGIRVDEGTLALVQMAKITGAVKQHSDKGLLFIAVVTNPTLGGASVCLASLADIVVADEDAIYGFTGKKIVLDTTREILPDDFQSSKFAKQHGMIDFVADADEIKRLVSWLLFVHEK